MSHPVIPANQNATIINGVPDGYGGKDDRNILVKAKDAVVHAVKGDPTPSEKVECYAKKQKDLADDMEKHEKTIRKEQEKAEKLQEKQMKHASKAAAAEVEKNAKMEQMQSYAARVDHQAEGAKTANDFAYVAHNRL